MLGKCWKTLGISLQSMSGHPEFEVYTLQSLLKSGVIMVPLAPAVPMSFVFSIICFCTRLLSFMKSEKCWGFLRAVMSIVTEVFYINSPATS